MLTLITIIIMIVKTMMIVITKAIEIMMITNLSMIITMIIKNLDNSTEYHKLIKLLQCVLPEKRHFSKM